jgi:hypothetical protein
MKLYQNNPGKSPRILMISHRGQKEQVANSTLYEFEDQVCQLDSVDFFYYDDSSTEVVELAKISTWEWMKAKAQNNSLTRPLFSRAQSLLWASPLRRLLTRPSTQDLALQTSYELFYTVLSEAWEVIQLTKRIPQWRERCRFASCHLVEVLYKDLEGLKLLKPYFQPFDQIYLGNVQLLSKVETILERPCTYLPMTVDAIKFCPYPTLPVRSVDLAYIGRRSAVTHQALLDLAYRDNFFYLYDTAKQFSVSNYREHRSLLANQLKRSRYFVANKARADSSDVQHRQEEIGYRFFEGAAAGTVMLGSPPKTEVFNRYFDWPDAIIPVPFDVPNIGQILQDLNAQSDRLEQIRRNNVINCLRRYDWLYLWQRILTDAQLDGTWAMQQRQKYLFQLAELVNASASASSTDLIEYCKGSDWHAVPH